MPSIKTLAVALVAASSLSACATVQRYNPFDREKASVEPAAASMNASCDAQRATVESTLSTPEQRDAARAAMVAASCPNVPQ